jgi:hypothetical protein
MMSEKLKRLGQKSDDTREQLTAENTVNSTLTHYNGQHEDSLQYLKPIHDTNADFKAEN